VEINFPLNFKISSFSKYKKESPDEEILFNKINCLSEEKNDLHLVDHLGNFVDIAEEKEYLLDIFFDGISNYDKMSSFQKTRVFFCLLRNFINKINKAGMKQNFLDELSSCIFLFNIDLKSLQYLKLYLVKEDINNLHNLKDKIKNSDEMSVIYELNLSNFEIVDFQNMNFDNKTNVRVDLKNTFDPYT
jgi:hypothetical protein